jgi:hypothetical protein
MNSFLGFLNLSFILDYKEWERNASHILSECTTVNIIEGASILKSGLLYFKIMYNVNKCQRNLGTASAQDICSPGQSQFIHTVYSISLFVRLT